MAGQRKLSRLNIRIRAIAVWDTVGKLLAFCKISGKGVLTSYVRLPGHPAHRHPATETN